MKTKNASVPATAPRHMGKIQLKPFVLLAIAGVIFQLLLLIINEYTLFLWESLNVIPIIEIVPPILFAVFFIGYFFHKKTEKHMKWLTPISIIASIASIVFICCNRSFPISFSSALLFYLVKMPVIVWLPFIIGLFFSKNVAGYKKKVAAVFVIAQMIYLLFLFIELPRRIFAIDPLLFEMILIISLLLFLVFFSLKKLNANGHMGIIDHILLFLFTFGIGPFVWIYRATRALNEMPNERYSPGKEVLLCLFVPFYFIFWLYKHGRRIDALAEEKLQIYSNVAPLCLFLGILVPLAPLVASVISLLGIVMPFAALLIASIAMQNKINAIVTSDPLPKFAQE